MGPPGGRPSHSTTPLGRKSRPPDGVRPAPPCLFCRRRLDRPQRQPGSHGGAWGSRRPPWVPFRGGYPRSRIPAGRFGFGRRRPGRAGKPKIARTAQQRNGHVSGWDSGVQWTLIALTEGIPSSRPALAPAPDNPLAMSFGPARRVGMTRRSLTPMQTAAHRLNWRVTQLTAAPVSGAALDELLRWCRAELPPQA